MSALPARTAAAPLTEADVSRIVEMAWEDRTPFDAIKAQFGVAEAQVIALMRGHLKRSSFQLWRQRVTGRATKHAALQPEGLRADARHRASGRSPRR